LILYAFEIKEFTSVYQFVTVCMYLISCHFLQGMEGAYSAFLMTFKVVIV